MKKILNTISECWLMMAFAVVLVALVLFIMRVDTNLEKQRKIKFYSVVEKAYFEGQRDALNNDIRIEWNAAETHWQWKQSPWDNPGMQPYTNLHDERKYK
jgi:hypothetical protein